MRTTKLHRNKQERAEKERKYRIPLVEIACRRRLNTKSEHILLIFVSGVWVWGRTSRSMLAVNKLKVQHNNSSLFGPGLKYRRFSLLCFVCRMRTWGCEDFVNISWFYRKFLEIDSVEARADTLIRHGEARIAEKRTHISGVLCCQWTKAEKLNFDIMK